uniref:metallophosphoesterase n=1 Tax=Agathobacter sp. TaxID=2021311 RepID=UPI00405708D8
MTFKWLHFSDIHFNFKDYDTETMRTRLREYLEDKFAKKDALFFTGDFRFAGTTDKSYLPETTKFIKDLRSSLLDDSSHLYLTVGNHDVDRDSFRESTILSIKNKYTSSNGTLITQNSDYKQK